MKTTMKWFITIILGLLGLGAAIAATDDDCTRLVFDRARMSPPMIEHFGLDYRSENAYVANIEGHWYLITWAEVPCDEDEGDNDPAPVAGIECLGIPYEGTGVFIVDGQEYTFDGNLSFVVGVDMYWRWELYIEGAKILVFEQTAESPCHVIEDYRDEQ